jgi:hypothetical protein
VLARSVWCVQLTYYRGSTGIALSHDFGLSDLFVLNRMRAVKRNLASVSDVYLLRSHNAGGFHGKGAKTPKETHTRAAEHHENAAKAHRTAADHHGKGDHDKGHEESTKAHEHSAQAHRHSADAHGKSGEARTKK